MGYVIIDKTILDDREMRLLNHKSQGFSNVKTVVSQFKNCNVIARLARTSYRIIDPMFLVKNTTVWASRNIIR